MKQLWAAVLITYGVAQTFPLDMAPESVDDMYKGCSDGMNKLVNMYLLNETNMDVNFKKAWEKSDTAYRRKYEQINSLEKELFKAIYVYTLNVPAIYRDLNDAVRSQKSQYTTTFRFHALHFFLARAIQTLNAGKPKCLTSYRRTSVYFSQVAVNKEFRFGSFTSSSQGDYLAAHFGGKSCFKIVTCFGADIRRYSKFGQQEREVLIPPYEIFKVTKIIKGTNTNKQKLCNVIYEVQSTGNSSNLNCALFSLRRNKNKNPLSTVNKT